jgi:hypothetical protein
MDPNNQNPQGDGDAVKKLEQDLQNLTQQAAATGQTPAPVTPPAPLTASVPEVPPVAPVIPPTSAAPAEANVPSPEMPKKGSPLLIVAIILALVAVLAVVVYVFGAKLLAPQPTPTPIAVVETTPTPDPTANWKTYTNGKLLVSLRYPTENGLQVFTYPTNDLDIAINKGQYDPLYFELIRLPNLNLQDWYHKAYASTKQDQVQPPELQNGPQIDSLNSYKADFNLEGAGKITFIFIQKGIDLYEIHIPTTANSTQNQILSTFKFIEATPAASPVVSPTASPSSSPTATP